jgi:hypothetical protein
MNDTIATPLQRYSKTKPLGNAPLLSFRLGKGLSGVQSALASIGINRYHLQKAFFIQSNSSTKEVCSLHKLATLPSNKMDFLEPV